jgi:3-hydroxyethyl bacteriochlorophyllide a dehydrogenase
MKTQAIVFAGVDRVEVREVEVPTLGAKEVQVRTHCSAISSGTEGWCLHNKFSWAPTPYPCVPGYQRAGVITAVGSDVRQWQVGDRVMATVGQWSGGLTSFWGAHAAVANTPESEVYAIPPGVDDLEASATVVIQVGYNAAYRPTLRAGDWVVVYGDGLIGQFGAQAAKSRGARVILVGRRANRLALATQCGIDHGVQSGPEAVEKIRALVGAKHVPVILDTVQTVDCEAQYLPLLEHGRGQIVYSGFSPGDTWSNMGRLHQAELTTHYIAGWSSSRMKATLELMAQRKLRLAPLVTHRVPFSEGPRMYAMISNKSEENLGVVLDWAGNQGK